MKEEKMNTLFPIDPETQDDPYIKIPVKALKTKRNVTDPTKIDLQDISVDVLLQSAFQVGYYMSN